MGDSNFGPATRLPNGTYVKYNNTTKRWYLFDKKGNILTTAHLLSEIQEKAKDYN